LARKKTLLDVGEVIKEASFSLLGNRPPDPFSKKYLTIVDYMKSDEFKNSKPAYQQRVMRQALEHPNWTLAEARGHSKPTGASWQVSDEKGLLPDRVVWKNRKEDSYYGSYLSDLDKLLSEEMKYADFKKKWKGKTFTDINGVKHKAVTDRDVLARLAEFDELPRGVDVYQK